MRRDRDEALSALLDGALDAEAERRLRAELAASPELRARLEMLRAVDAELRALAPPPLAPELAERLRARIAAGEGQAGSATERRPSPLGPAPRARAPRRRRPLAIAASLAAVAAIGLVLGWPEDAAPPASPPLAHQDPTPGDARGESADAAELLLGSEAGQLPEPPEAEDLAVIEVLDWLAALDALEAGGPSG